MKPSPTATRGARVLEIEALCQHGCYHQAESECRAMLAQQENVAPLEYLLAYALSRQAKFHDALPHFEHAWAADKRVKRHWLGLIDALIECGEHGQAQEKLQQADKSGLRGSAFNDLRKRLRTTPASGQGVAATPMKPSLPEMQAVAGAFGQGLLQSAEALALQLAQKHPEHGFAWKVLGAVHLRREEPERAIAPMQKAVACLPADAEAWSNLGVALQTVGRLEEAEAAYRHALTLDERRPHLRFNLGTVLIGQGKFSEAEPVFHAEVRAEPGNAIAHAQLGAVLRELKRGEEAVMACEQSIRLDASVAGVHNNLGAALFDLHRYQQAEQSYRRAVTLSPDWGEAHRNLATCLVSLGNHEEARAMFWRAHELGVDGARIHALMVLPSVMGTRSQLMQERATLERNLEQLLTSEERIADPAQAGCGTNFYLAYHGLNDRDLQVKVARCYEHISPALMFQSPHCGQERPTTTPRVRVGFYSNYMYGHSVSRSYRAIIEALAKEPTLEVLLISTGVIDRSFYSGFEGECLQLPTGLSEARTALAQRELDVLVYLDIGMDPHGYFLAYSRLARVQCVLGGHPVTTGIRNVDFFLSADQLEPPNAQEHYSEKLVRFAHPVYHFSRPIMPERMLGRPELGLPEEQRLYMCPMRLQKLHPDFDAAMAAILQRDAQAVITLFEDKYLPLGRNRLEQRFAQTIPHDLRDRILFVPWVENTQRFISTIAQADVVLDPFHFGFGTTAALTFVTGTPLVTLPGEFMRGRVGMALCEMLRVPECIAHSEADYVTKAVRIANDRDLRARLSKKILDESDRFYDNPAPISDLRTFLLNAV